MNATNPERRPERRRIAGQHRRRHIGAPGFLWSLKRDEDKMDDADLLDDIHNELEERRLRFSKIALGLAMLALIALWCACQTVVP